MVGMLESWGISKKFFQIGDHLIPLKPNCIAIIAETHLITYKHISQAYL